MFAVHDKVSELVLATVGSESVVHLEVSPGCIVTYITFREGCTSSFDELASGLISEGAQLTFVVDKDSHMGFLTSERLRGTQLMSVYDCVGKSVHN